MAYLGNSELSPRAQERVMSAFRLVISNLQDGRKDDALVGLDFVLRLDPSFSPALALQEQLSTGEGTVSLQGVLAQIDAPATEEINLLLVDAIEDFEQHHFVEAKEKVRKVLLDLPGHEDARNLSRQIDEALEKEAQVGHFLTQAREALDAGDPQEASNFVMMAQALDPHHPGIHATLEEIQGRGRAMVEKATAGAAQVESQPPAEPAMPEGFELEAPNAGDFGEEAPAEAAVEVNYDGPSDFESSGVGDLFEDIGAPPEGDFPPVGDLFEADEAARPEKPIDVDPAAQDTYAASADNWKRQSPGDQPAEDAPGAPAAEEVPGAEEPPWGPDFENFGDDVSDLFSTDSVDGLSTDAEPALREDFSGLEEAQVETGVAEQDFSAPAEAEAAPAIEEIPAAEDLPEGLPDVPEPSLEGGAEAEEDLFSDDFSMADEIDALEERSRSAGAMPVASRGVSLKMFGLGVLALVVLLGGMWLGMRLMGSGDLDENRAQVVHQLLNDADGLLKQGKPEEALHLLENFQADDIEKQRIQKHILRIKDAMAPPTPTPAPMEAVKAREMLAGGDWFGAFEEVQNGLLAHPQDPGLQDLKTEIVRTEAQAMPLYRAMEQKDDHSIASISMELERKYPTETKISELVDRSLFNGALKELRSYNLTGARVMLAQLHDRRPDDVEVARILKFSSKYSKKPVDMQLEIFVGSIRSR